MTGVRVLARGVRAGLACATLAMVLTLPAAVVAGTIPEPSEQPCAPGVLAPVAVAGTPYQVRGTSRPGETVDLGARRADGKSAFGSVVTTENGTWVGTFIFDASDGGSWTVEVVVGELRCGSLVTVTLPAGVVAPPTDSPEQLQQLGASTGGPSLKELGVNAAVLLIAGSWLFLALLRIARTFTGWPKIRGVLRRITQLAVFISVLGACLLAWVALSVIVALPHFFSSIPPDQQAVLDVVGLGALVVGSLLGTLAALRVGTRWWVEDVRA